MKHQAGFTLLEMLMVLAIIAMVSGAVVTGQHMMRVSQLQTVALEYQGYASAIKTFQDKYNAIPGDARAATAIDLQECLDVTVLDIMQACRGDGDGTVDIGTTTEHNENIYAWRQMFVGAILPQAYSGFDGREDVSHPCAYIHTENTANRRRDFKIGNEIPASKLKAAGWNLMSSINGTAYSPGVTTNESFTMSDSSDSPRLLALHLGGRLQIDAAADTGCAVVQVPVMTAKEAYELDYKQDDGNSATGRIRAQYTNTSDYTNCMGGAASTGGYNTTSAATNCALAFILSP